MAVFYLWPEGFEVLTGFMASMRLPWVLGLFAATAMLIPFGAADAPTIKVTVTSDVSSVRLEPGERETVDLNVTVELIDFTCASGTKVGVDLVPASSSEDWFGAEPHPDGDTYATPKETKPATLTVVTDGDAPGGEDGTFRLQPVVHIPAPQSCNLVEPAVDAPEFSIRVTTIPSKTSPGIEGTSGPSDDGNNVPAPGLSSILLLGLAVGLFGRRRE